LLRQLHRLLHLEIVVLLLLLLLLPKLLLLLRPRQATRLSARVLPWCPTPDAC